MNMQTTLGVTEARARAEQLRGEILSALAEAEEPLTSRQLLDLCDSAESIEQLTKQIGSLKTTGEIVQDGLRAPATKKRGAKPFPTYRLASTFAPLAPEETACLADVIEATMETVWEHSTNAQSGDEFHACCGKCQAPAPLDPLDPVLVAIARLRPLAAFPNADMHAQRLAELADQLTEMPDSSVVCDWLIELADELVSLA